MELAGPQRIAKGMWVIELVRDSPHHSGPDPIGQLEGRWGAPRASRIWEPSLAWPPPATLLPAPPPGCPPAATGSCHTGPPRAPIPAPLVPPRCGPSTFNATTHPRDFPAQSPPCLPLAQSPPRPCPCPTGPGRLTGTQPAPGPLPGMHPVPQVLIRLFAQMSLPWETLCPRLERPF